MTCIGIIVLTLSSKPCITCAHYQHTDPQILMPQNENISFRISHWPCVQYYTMVNWPWVTYICVLQPLTCVALHWGISVGQWFGIHTVCTVLPCPCQCNCIRCEHYVYIQLLFCMWQNENSSFRISTQHAVYNYIYYMLLAIKILSLASGWYHISPVI